MAAVLTGSLWSSKVKLPVTPSKLPFLMPSMTACLYSSGTGLQAGLLGSLQAAADGQSGVVAQGREAVG